jgi:hypothetical protein
MLLVLSLFFRLDFSCFPRLARIFLWKFAGSALVTFPSIAAAIVVE